MSKDALVPREAGEKGGSTLLSVPNGPIDSSLSAWLAKGVLSL